MESKCDFDFTQFNADFFNNSEFENYFENTFSFNDNETLTYNNLLTAEFENSLVDNLNLLNEDSSRFSLISPCQSSESPSSIDTTYPVDLANSLETSCEPQINSAADVNKLNLKRRVHSCDAEDALNLNDNSNLQLVFKSPSIIPFCDNTTINTAHHKKKIKLSQIQKKKNLYDILSLYRFNGRYLSQTINQQLNDYVHAISLNLPMFYQEQDVYNLENSFSLMEIDHTQSSYNHGTECYSLLRGCRFLFFSIGKPMDSYLVKRILHYSEGGGYVPNNVHNQILEEIFAAIQKSSINIDELVTLRGLFVGSVVNHLVHKFYLIYQNNLFQLREELLQLAKANIKTVEQFYNTNFNVGITNCEGAKDNFELETEKGFNSKRIFPWPKIRNVNETTFFMGPSTSTNYVRTLLFGYLKQVIKTFLKFFTDDQLDLIEYSPLSSNFISPQDCSKSMIGLRIIVPENNNNKYITIYRKQHYLSSATFYGENLDRLVQNEVWGSEENYDLIRLLCCGGAICGTHKNSLGRTVVRGTIMTCDFVDERKCILWAKIGIDEKWVFAPLPDDNNLVSLLT
ncbi:hypothetical protein HDU92_002013 [Lobulomyces angularis]|nr:hypothetical protein HDU92_002013 [Lobulomyces angularis]